MRCRALRVSRSGSPGPQPIRATRPLPGAARAVQLSGEHALGLGLRAAQNGVAERALQQPLPQAAARSRIGDGPGNEFAQALRPPGKSAEVGRQPLLEPGLDLARQHRGSTFGADRHRDRIAIDDGRRDEGGQLRHIDDVDRDAAHLRRMRHGRVLLAIAGGRIDQPLAGDIADGKRAAHDGQATLPGQSLELGRSRLGDDGDARIRLEQEAHLLGGLLAAAGNQHLGVLDIGEDGKVLHRGSDQSVFLKKPPAALPSLVLAGLHHAQPRAGLAHK